MGTTMVDTDPFFESKFKFPWNFMGLTLPCAGSLHGYIGTAIAPYYPDPFRSMLSGNPALFEMKRFARAHGDIFKEIVDYCDRVESNRDSVASKVLGFLVHHHPFRSELQKRIDDAWRLGSINIPKECQPKEKWKREQW